MSEKPHLNTAEELELRQDDVLRQLDELNSQLERVLLDAAPGSNRAKVSEGSL